MAYHGLNAGYDCGYFSSSTTGAVYDTTIAYAPDALSTYVGPLWMPAQTGPEAASYFQAINYTEFGQYEANTANEGYSKNLKIPSDLATIDPAWSTCIPGVYGSWDPPRVLTAAQNMVAPTPKQQAIDPLATAVPAAGIASIHVPAAPTPSPKGSANGFLDPDPTTPTADPGPESKDTQSNGGKDPSFSVSQADNPSHGADPGDDPTPVVKQGQDSDPANQQISPQDSSPNQSTAGASTNSPAAGGSNADNDDGVDPILDIDPQNSKNAPKGSLALVDQLLSFKPVVLASPTPLVFGDSTIERAPKGGAVIGTSTYTAGYKGQISNIPISIGIDNIVFGTTTYALPTSTPVLIGGQSIVKAANGGVIIDTSTYPLGSQAQSSNKPLSVGIDSVVVGGTSYAIPTAGTANTAFIESQSVSRAPNGGIILGSGATIGLGSQSIINGHTISVGPSSIVVDDTSYALPSSAGAVLQSPYPQPNAPVTLNNSAILKPGGTAVLFTGTAYAIPSDDSGLVINGQTVPLSTQTTPQSIFTAADQIFTASPTGFTLGGQSVALDGSAATLDGTVISLGPSGLQIGSTTIPLTSAQTAEVGLVGLIMSGFGSGGESSTTIGGGNGSSVLAFTGESIRVRTNLSLVYFGSVGMVMGVVALFI